MYALSESLLEPTGEYRVETFNLSVHGFEELTHVELKIFGEGEYESYICEYTIMFGEDKEISGACLNRKTKEETIIAVEDAVITALKKYREIR